MIPRNIAAISDLLEKERRRKEQAEALFRASQTSPLTPTIPDDIVDGRGIGPRRANVLAPAGVSAPAPRPFEKGLAQALMAGTKKTTPFGGEEELTEKPAQSLRVAKLGRAVAEDVGKAVVGQPGRSVYRMATGIANIRNDPRAKRLTEQLQEIERETAPTTSLGVIPRLAAEMGAFAGSGLVGGAVRSGLEGAAGAESSTASMISERLGAGKIDNPLARGVADAALDLAIPAAMSKRVRSMIGKPFQGSEQAADLGRAISERSATPRPRTGAASPPVVGGLGGFGAGAVTGLAVEDEDGEGMSPLQRALAYGAAGAVGGAAAGAKLYPKRKAEQVQPTIPSLAALAQTINIGQRELEDAPKMLSRGGSLKTGIVASTYPIEYAVRKFGGEDAGFKAEKAIARQQGSPAAAKGYLEETLQPTLQSLSKGERDDVRVLMKGRRDLQIRLNGGEAKSPVPLEELQQIVDDGNSVPKIAEAADKLTAVHRDMLKRRFDAGLISKEAYDEIVQSDDFYTPFFREANKDPVAAGVFGVPRSGGVAMRSGGVARMDREAAALENTADPFEAVAVDVLRTYRDVSRQRVSNVIFSLADDKKIPFLKRIEGEAGEGSARSQGRLIETKRDGVNTAYEVTDPELYLALSGQSSVVNNMFVKYASLLKKTQTAGIVLNPVFSAANIIRDVAMSGVQRPDRARALREGAIAGAIGGSVEAANAETPAEAMQRFAAGAALGVGAGMYARPFYDSMAAVADIVGNKDVFRQFLRDGASTEGFFIRTPDDAASLIKKLEKTPGFSAKDIISPKKWWEVMQTITSVGEQATRLAAYKQVQGQVSREFADIYPTVSSATPAMLSNPVPRFDPTIAAQDRTLRLSQSGSDRFIKGATATTPFFNAKLQGWDKLGRMMKDPKTSAMAAAMLTAPTIALWTVNKDNPAYWERPVWERNLFWLIPKGGATEEGEDQFYRVPKPFELGFMFASLPERLLDYAVQSKADMKFFDFGQVSNASPEVAEPEKLLGRSAADMAGTTFEGTLPVPNILSLPGQLAFDYDTFRDRPIVSKPELSPELQVTGETSAIARALAKVGAPPEMTEFFIRNAFGSLGTEASKAVDIAARAAGLPAPEGAKGIRGIPLVGAFSDRFTTSKKGQTDTEALAKERIRSIARIEADYRELKRRAETGSAKDSLRLERFAEKNLDDLLLAEEIQPIETQLRDLSRRRTMVRQSNEYSGEEKRDMLELLREEGKEISALLIGVKKKQSKREP